MKKGKIAGVLALSACMLTGCVDNMPDMTEEENELVAEYAADLMLKYSSNYNYRIAEDSEVEALMAEEAAQEETTQEETTEPETASQEVQTETVAANMEEAATEAATEEGSEFIRVEDIDLAAELGVEGISITYTSSELADSYPKAEAGSGFSVTAPSGKKLLILHFSIENTSADTVTCDLLDQLSKVRVRTNEAGYKEALSTMLTNDFTMYLEELAAGETQDAVIVATVNEQAAQELTAVIVRITTADGNTVEFQVE